MENNIILPADNNQPSVTLMGDSFAMTLLKNNLKAEQTRARVNALVIIILTLAFVFTTYMILSYFANVSIVGGGNTTQTAENNGDNNTIDQRG